MSGNVPQDQEEEFKEYLDKAGVLELLTVPSCRVTVSGNASQEQENEEFKEYLDKAGVLEFLTSALVKLYEEPVKPRDALEYLKNSIEGAKAEKEEIAKLTTENDDLKKKIDELEKKEAELKEKIMEATTLRASETKDKMEEMGVADPPINTTGIDTNNIAMETPAAAEVSATAVHKDFNQKKDAPVEEAAETQDVKGAETPTTNGHTEEEEVAEAPCMEVGNINSLFSNEVLEFLLGLLPHHDRKSAVLVCKHWREIGEGPNLWTWVKLLVTSGNLADMPEIICLSRLAKVEKITLEAISKEVLQAIEKHQGFKLLDISECYVSHIDSDLLARVITRIEEVRLEYTKLNTKQWNDIFNSMSNGAKLKKMNINWISLSKANPQSMAKAISTLEVVRLVHSGLTSEQSKAMFELLAFKSKLKSLEIRRGDLSSVAGQTLAMVVSQVEEATLDAGLTIEQWTAIFIKAAEESSKLKVLNIGGYGSNGFSQLDANLMATAVNKLEKVDLHLAFLNARQCRAIFGYAAGNSNLKDLDISINDLSSVNQYDMSKAVHNMEKINLNSTKLTNQQCTQIFKYAENHSNLKVLNIRCNDLHSVEPGSIAKTVSKMEECTLGSSNLTSQQLGAIFKQLSEDSKLKKLDMCGVTVSSVEENVISKAIANLEEVNLGRTHLTTHQLEAIFMEIKSSRKLKVLDLQWTDLRSVQIESIVGAIANLEEVQLGHTYLTTQQLEAIFMEIKSSRKLKILGLRWTDLRSVQIDSLVGALSCLEVVYLIGASLTPEQLDAVKSIREDCGPKVYM